VEVGAEVGMGPVMPLFKDAARRRFDWLSLAPEPEPVLRFEVEPSIGGNGK